MEIEAGYGKTLPEIWESLFGGSRESKAFRALAKMAQGTWDEGAAAPLLPLGNKVLMDLAGSQEFKIWWKELRPSWNLFKLNMGAFNPVGLYNALAYELGDIKKYLGAELAKGAPKLSSQTRKFLLDWVNTDVHSLPRPDVEIIKELSRFRPSQTRIYFRGVRFHDIGELVQFHKQYGTGKAFPFLSKRASSWSRSMQVAERFARYHGAGSQNEAMMGWFNRMKSNKDYDGKGGFLMGARIAPESIMVDFSNPDLPFQGGVHGDEAEVILLPNVKLVTKVYGIYGDVDREIEAYAKSWENKTPLDQYFFGGMYPFYGEKQTGDAESGTVKFKIYEDDPHMKVSPEEIERGQDKVIGGFRQHMYDAKWVGPLEVRYERMSAPQRVAFRFSRG